MTQPNREPKSAEEAHEALLTDEWQHLLEKDDRTSEHPDMCLITRDELGEAIRAGYEAALAYPETEHVEPEGEVDAPKRAPVQDRTGVVKTIPWELHLRAYVGYCKKWGPQAALLDLEGRNCRGGFGTGELDDFVPGWRDELPELEALSHQVERLKAGTGRAPSEGEVDALVAEARASTVDACVAYFRREFSTDPDAHTLAAIREAEANAPLTVVFTDDDLAALRREVWAGLPIAIPDGTVTPDGPPPTDDMVIEQGRRRRIWDGYRTHPGTVLALLNTIDRLASALSSRRALSREEVGALIEPDLQWAVGGPCYDWPAHQAGRERALSKADAILSRVEGK